MGWSVDGALSGNPSTVLTCSVLTSALYYPWMHFQDDNWVKLSLLTWDSVVRVRVAAEVREEITPKRTRTGPRPRLTVSSPRTSISFWDERRVVGRATTARCHSGG